MRAVCLFFGSPEFSITVSKFSASIHVFMRACASWGLSFPSHTKLSISGVYSDESCLLGFSIFSVGTSFHCVQTSFLSPFHSPFSGVILAFHSFSGPSLLVVFSTHFFAGSFLHVSFPHPSISSLVFPSHSETQSSSTSTTSGFSSSQSTISLFHFHLSVKVGS